MKHKLIALLPAIALLAGCAAPLAPSAPAPPSAPSAPAAPVPPTPPAPPAAPGDTAVSATAVKTPAAQAELRIVLIDCNSVRIVEEDGKELNFSGSSKVFSSSVSDSVNGSTTMTVRQTVEDGQWDTFGTLTVPAGVYSSIYVDTQNSGVNVTPRLADYTVIGSENAVGVNLSQGYTGKIMVDQSDSACSVSLDGEFPNLSVNLSVVDCAAKYPDTWKKALDGGNSFTRGTGGPALDLKYTDCALSIEESALGFSYDYQAKNASVSFISTSLEEALLTDRNLVQNVRGDLRTYKDASKPNTVKEIKTIPKDGITSLQIGANLCGVVLEPSKSGNFELSYIGVENTADIPVTTTVKDGVLTVIADGKTCNERYINLSADWRVNCVRLGVPEGALSGIALDGGTALLNSSGIVLPTVTGGFKSGRVSLQTDTLTNPVTMSTVNGSLLIDAKTVSAAVSLDTVNGSAKVKAGTVNAEVTLNTINGSASVAADSIAAKTTAAAVNGSVKAIIKEIQADTVLKAENGSIKAELGRITGNVTCAVDNGTLKLKLTQKPTDLTLHLKNGRWAEEMEKNAQKDGRKTDDFNLPGGWYDGMVLGNGKPSLTLSVASNGYIGVEVP